MLSSVEKCAEGDISEVEVETTWMEWGIEISENLFLIPEILLSARVEKGFSQGRSQRGDLYTGDIFQD